MNKLRISLTENNSVIKGSIKLEGDTTFIKSSLVEVIKAAANAFDTTADKVLKDIYG